LDFAGRPEPCHDPLDRPVVPLPLNDDAIDPAFEVEAPEERSDDEKQQSAEEPERLPSRDLELALQGGLHPMPFPTSSAAAAKRRAPAPCTTRTSLAAPLPSSRVFSSESIRCS
jgi:hypothetical protein